MSENPLQSLIQREALASERCHLAQTLDGAAPCDTCTLCAMTKAMRLFDADSR